MQHGYLLGDAMHKPSKQVGNTNMSSNICVSRGMQLIGTLDVHNVDTQQESATCIVLACASKHLTRYHAISMRNRMRTYIVTLRLLQLLLWMPKGGCLRLHDR